ncbi:MAG TPA: M14 metallopeptidase family protein, partial [Vicinamibacterales bacterium]
MYRRTRPLALGLAAIIATLLLAAAVLQARTGRITTPKEQFGFNIGDDYQLANYQQLMEYWKKLDRESDRMTLEEIGRTAEGRPQLMAIVTAPENHRRLDRYKEISRRLALAEGLTEEQARALAEEGKAVVWIDGGLHATEVLGAQQLIEMVYQMVSRTDAETMRFLRDVIILFVHANPDGHDLVADWYMREKDVTKRTFATIPRLYQKYIGHDNNRDSYMSTQPETTNMNRILFREWFPQIMYNHHQTGPTGTVLFAPPFRDPFNYVFDPLIPLGIDLVGAAMHNRFAAEGKPGATMRRGANYSTWWNGGLRTTVYYHNMIGLLTETIGHPTPMEIPFVPTRNLPSGDLPYPITPQKWHFRQSIEYSVTANRAVLDVASRHREQFLYNIYLMGKRSIDRGNTDTWTMYPSRVAKVQE